MHVGIAGASGYAGAELLRLCAGHPDLDVVVAGADSQAGRARRRALPLAGRRLPVAGLLQGRWPTTSTASTSSSWPCPTVSPQRLVPELVDRVGVLVDLSADFRLRDAGRLPGLVRRRPRGARAPRPLRLRPARAVPGRARKAPASSPPRAATRRRPPWRSPRSCGPGSSRPSGIVVDAASGISGAGRTPSPATHFATVDEDFTAYGLLTHRHTPEIEQATGAAGALHPAPGPDEPGHPGHLLRPAHGRCGGDRRRPRRSWPTPTRDEPFVVVSDASPVDQGDLRLERRPPHRARRRAHRMGRSCCAPSTTWCKGASGQAVQCANIALGLARDDRVCDGWGSIHERHGAGGVRGRRHRLRDQGVGRAWTSPSWPPTTAAPVPAAGVFTSNLAAAAPVQVSRGPPGRHRRPGGGRGPLERERQRRHRGPGRGRRRADVRARWRRASVWPRPRSSSCQTGSHRHPPAHGPHRVGHPRPGGGARRGAGGGRPGGHGHHDDRHRAQGGRGRGGGFTVGGMAKGAAHAGAEHGHHAGRAHHRRRVRAPGAGRRAARRRGRDVQPADRRRLHVDQRHGARAGQRPRRDVP